MQRVRVMREAATLSLGLAMCGCGEPTPAADVELATGVERAEVLGAFLLPVIEDVSAAKDASSLEGVDALCEALHGVVGPAPTDVAGGLRLIDDAITYQPGQCNGLVDAANVDGRVTLNIASLTPLFFYEYTLIDTSTGLLYQSCRGVNTGCDTELLEFFGPLVPPEDARLIGDFDTEERSALQDVIREALR